MAYKVLARTVGTARAGKDAVQVGQPVYDEKQALGMVAALARNPRVIVAWYAAA